MVSSTEAAGLLQQQSTQHGTVKTLRPRRKFVNLEKFEGSTPLKTFLAKFGNCSRYNEWDGDERVAFLRNNLTGNASQVLWQIADDATDDGIIIIPRLRNRYGSLGQPERFRAELPARRRKKGESI